MMPEINQFDGSKQKFIIYQGYIHFLPHENEEDDIETNEKQYQ